LKFLIFSTTDDDLLSLAILPAIEQEPMQPMLCALLIFLAPFVSFTSIDAVGDYVSSNWIQAHFAQATVIVTRRDKLAAGFPTIIMRP
jgi:hypothetical protein